MIKKSRQYVPIKVMEFEFNSSSNQLDDIDHAKYSKIQILVRMNSVPIGYAWINIDENTNVNNNYIRSQIEIQLQDSIFIHKTGNALFNKYGNFISELKEYELPKVTIALCTEGKRINQLETALTSLKCLDYPKDKLEILVVDNSRKSSNVKNILKNYTQFKYCVEEIPGLNWARNRAIEEAKGDLIAYIDDDVRVDKLWLKSAVTHFINPAVMCVTGLVVPAERDTLAQNFFEEYGGFGKGFQLKYYTFEMRRNWRFFPLGAGMFGTGCNMVFRKTLFNHIGNFDVALDMGTPTNGGGDLDIFYRTLCAGYILVYTPQAFIWHYHRQKYNQLKTQLRNFGTALYAFYAKTFITDRKNRLLTIDFMFVWYLRWFVIRILKPEKFPRKLILAEAFGSLYGCFAYLISRRKQYKIIKRIAAENT